MFSSNFFCKFTIWSSYIPIKELHMKCVILKWYQSRGIRKNKLRNWNKNIKLIALQERDKQKQPTCDLSAAISNYEAAMYNLLTNLKKLLQREQNSNSIETIVGNWEVSNFLPIIDRDSCQLCIGEYNHSKFMILKTFNQINIHT
jgi:hypothetical protein